MRRVAVLALVTLAATPACAWLSQESYYDRKISSFERERPDAEALARGDVASLQRVLGWMSDWQTKISQDHDVSAVPRQRLIDRLDAAGRRLRLAAAAVAAPEIGFALARAELDHDPAALALVRRGADGVAAQRQRELARTGSYFHARDAAWETTDEAMWVDEGEVSTYERRELRDQPASCVFATSPFGPEGVANPDLAYRVTGPHPRIFGRCYLQPEPNDLPADGASMDIAYASEGGGSGAIAAYGKEVPGDHPHVDFVIADQPRRPLFDGARAYADLDVEVTYAYVTPAGDRVQRVLARSKVFWDRDGAPPRR